MASLPEQLTQLGKQKLTVEEFTKQARELGCRSIILPGMITTADYRIDGSRVFAEVHDGHVISARIG